MKVLLLGSEPFGGLERNPAAEVVRVLAGRTIASADVTGLVLPVSYESLPGQISALVADHRPDVALGLGLVAGAAYVRIETTAINVADFDVADNQGAFIRNAPLDPRGPIARSATYDAPHLAALLRARGIPCRTSHHAGTHLCNLTLYNLLKAQAAAGGRGAFGFMHLPLLPAQAAELIEAEARRDNAAVRVALEYPSMDLALQKQAVELVVAELLAAIDRHGARDRDLVDLEQPR